MKKLFVSLNAVVLLAVLTVMGCKDENGNTVLLFSVEDDLALGQEVSAQIAADPETYPVLDRNDNTNKAAYDYLDNMVNTILNSGEVTYRSEFAWDVSIIHDDSVLNAFATPGGYIYVYTGLIKYLDNADALAGVLGHEIAHADLRHTSRNLQKEYGIQVLLSILLGEDAGTATQIATQIATGAAFLKFSRDYETEADEESVEYLAPTIYACDGAKIFFQKLEESGQGSGQPEFLSTHPSPDNRIANIEAKADTEQCSTELSDQNYQAFKDSLPE